MVAMKASDWLILKKLDDIEKLLVVQQVAINERFDTLEKLIVKGANVIPELENAVRNVSMLATSIDRKVPG
jgi:hypothetical protein